MHPPLMTVWTEPSAILIAETGIRTYALENFFKNSYICSEQTALNPMKIRSIIQVRGTPAEQLTVFAGRNCYQSFESPKTVDDYMKNILESKHGSVLEHASVSFIISGVSRSLTHELVRHRAGFAYSQLSQRYVDESVTSLVVPPNLVFDRMEYEERFAKINAAILRIGKYLAVNNGKIGMYVSPQERPLNFTFYSPKQEVKEDGPSQINLQKMRVGELQRSLVHLANICGPEKHAAELKEQLAKNNVILPELPEDGYERQQCSLLYNWLMQNTMAFRMYSELVAGKLYKKNGEKPSTAERKEARGTARSILPNCTETKIVVTANFRAWRHFLEQRGSLHADEEIRNLAFKIFWQLQACAPACMGGIEVKTAEVNGIKKQYLDFTYSKV